MFIRITTTLEGEFLVVSTHHIITVRRGSDFCMITLINGEKIYTNESFESLMNRLSSK